MERKVIFADRGHQDKLQELLWYHHMDLFGETEEHLIIEQNHEVVAAARLIAEADDQFFLVLLGVKDSEQHRGLGSKILSHIISDPWTCSLQQCSSEAQQSEGLDDDKQYDKQYDDNQYNDNQYNDNQYNDNQYNDNQYYDKQCDEKQDNVKHCQRAFQVRTLARGKFIGFYHKFGFEPCDLKDIPEFFSEQCKVCPEQDACQPLPMIFNGGKHEKSSDYFYQST